MYDKAIPIFEVKNRLSYFLHKAKAEGPVFISNRGKPEFVLQTLEEYEQQIQAKPKEKSLILAIAKLQKKHNIYATDFTEDLTEFFDKLRDHNYLGPTNPENIFNGVLS